MGSTLRAPGARRRQEFYKVGAAIVRNAGVKAMFRWLIPMLMCATAPLAGADALHPAELGSTARVHEQGGALLASQPAAADLGLARARGVRTVISLRRADEPVGYDEPAEAERIGLDYVPLPWLAPDDLTDELFGEARRLLRDTPRPLLLHCGSGNRVAAVWLPWRVLDDGAPLEVALAEAREIGLASPEYERRARDYIERQKADR
jgi:protein tyrosine phosphatase (PTP) superfamily phosphohydrolase (DUF442 family)